MQNSSTYNSIPLTRIVVTPCDDHEHFNENDRQLLLNQPDTTNFRLRISPNVSRRNSECEPYEDIADSPSPNVFELTKRISDSGETETTTPNYGTIATTSGSHLTVTDNGRKQKDRSERSSLTAGETEILISSSNHDKSSSQHEKGWFSQVKTVVVFLIVIVCSVVIAVSPEKEASFKQFTVSNDYVRRRNISWPSGKGSLYDSVLVQIRGNVLLTPSPSIPHANVTLQLKQMLENGAENLQNWTLLFASADNPDVTESDAVHKFSIDTSEEAMKLGNLILEITTPSFEDVPFGLNVKFLFTAMKYDTLFAAIILLFVYVLIIFELVHRCLAAIVGSLMTVAVLSLFSMRPQLMTLINWIDFETLTLLFGMMIMVSIFCETGFFDWIALQAYKMARGRAWPLMIILCVVSAVISAFLDNVTTVLLLSPVTIRLCEALRLDPKRILIAEVIFSNIGGTATAVGDPPNVIIVSSSELRALGVNFANFTLHMSVGIFFVIIGAFGLLFILYRNLGDPASDEDYNVVEIRREIEVWRRTAFSISVASKEESAMKQMLIQKVRKLENRLKKLKNSTDSTDNFETALRDMETKYCITNKWLLVKCSVVMVIVIIVFFVASVVDGLHLELGWIAFLGSVWLMVLADFAELESILHRVEWATLIFFAALFTLMHGLEILGLITFIGDQVSSLIVSLPASAQLTVAIILILWVSALASAFIDNIPFTTTMIPVLLKLASDNETANLPILPLVWSLAFGACLGGNGTLIGASANVVAAGIAQQHGYGFSFKDFFKVGFPMMLWTVFLSMIYLLICHSWAGWNYT